MIIAWSEKAWEEFIEWDLQDRNTVKKIFKLLKDIERNGYYGIGKPEALTGDLSGYFSRRIDGKNRIVYKIDGDFIKIAQCKGHYGDH